MNEDFRRRYQAQLEQVIARYGWAVQGVFPTEEDPGLPFHYTVGLHDQGLPELLVFGLPMPVGQRLLNEVGALLMARKTVQAPLQGRLALEDWPMPFALVGTRDGLVREYATVALARSQGSARVLQVVWPDREGRFPWEQGVTLSYLQAQPMLYDPEQARKQAA